MSHTLFLTHLYPKMKTSVFGFSHGNFPCLDSSRRVKTRSSRLYLGGCCESAYCVTHISDATGRRAWPPAVWPRGAAARLIAAFLWTYRSRLFISPWENREISPCSSRSSGCVRSHLVFVLQSSLRPLISVSVGVKEKLNSCFTTWDTFTWVKVIRSLLDKRPCQLWGC